MSTITLKKIQKILQNKSSKKVCQSFNKFVPNSQNVYGVKVPILNDLAKAYKKSSFELVEILWKSGAFEEQILAAKILKNISKKDPDRTLNLVKKFSKKISNWAICDTLGQQSIKLISELKQREIFDLSKKLVKSKNFWERRFSLVILENFKKDIKSKEFITEIMKQLENDKEYYVKKAVEWTRRDLAKLK